MKISFAARLVLTAVLLTTGASAAPVPANSVVKAPNWSAGSEWHYSDGYAVKVASVSPKGTLFQRLDAPGQSFMRDGFIRTDSTSATATRKAIYRTVPDNAGQSLSAAKPLTFQREYQQRQADGACQLLDRGGTRDHHRSGGHLRLLGDRVAHAFPALGLDRL